MFTIYINNTGNNVLNANFHLYADDTVIYCSSPTQHQALCHLQDAFNTVQVTFRDLKLFLNPRKTKLIMFSNAKPQDLPSIIMYQGDVIKLVSSYKYLGFLIDDALSFKLHIQQLVKKLKLRLGFYFRNKSCFSFAAKKRLVAGIFLSLMDYGDVLYMHASSQCLHSLDSVYHGALRFIICLKALTHHCDLYS